MTVPPHRTGGRIEDDEPARLRSDPELSAPIGVQCEDRHTAEKSTRRAIRERCRTRRAVEAVKPIVAGDPEPSATLVGDAVDGARTLSDVVVDERVVIRRVSAESR